MELEVYWTAQAEYKLEDIFHYYKSKATAQVAKKYVHELVDKTILLKKNPELGPREPLLTGRSQEFRYLVHKNHKIIYWASRSKNRIEISTIFDCRQNP